MRSRAVLPLGDIQRLFRNAMVDGETTSMGGLLVGGRDPLARLAIHVRHYEASLVTAILGKYPAAAWLIGTPFLTQVAQEFVRLHPPEAPCIAEYADGFPEFLACRPGAERLPFLRAFARLEWQIGQASLAVPSPPVAMADLAALDVEILPDLVLSLQPGLHYLDAAWPVDELIAIFLSENAAEHSTFAPCSMWLQISGARGAFTLTRLDAGSYAFRVALHGGATIGEASERALSADAAFDPGSGLAALVADDRIAGFKHDTRRHT